MTAFTSTFVLNILANRMKGQTIDTPLAGLNLPGFELASVSPIDPTGWVRVILTPVAR